MWTAALSMSGMDMILRYVCEVDAARVTRDFSGADIIAAIAAMPRRYRFRKP